MINNHFTLFLAHKVMGSNKKRHPNYIWITKKRLGKLHTSTTRDLHEKI
jgi:hypothetical protein